MREEFTLSEENFIVFFQKESHTGVAMVVHGRYKNLVLGARATNNHLAVIKMNADPLPQSLSRHIMTQPA